MTVYKIDPSDPKATDALKCVVSDGTIAESKIGEDGRIWIKTERTQRAATERTEEQS